MIVTDAVEGTIGQGGNALWFHYDVSADVLYLRLAAAREAETVTEESDEGYLVLRRTSDDAAVGLTVVSWWKRFGTGDRPDSFSQLEKAIEPWAERVAA